MKKESFVLGISLLLCIGSLTGCGFLDEKEAATSSQEIKENATKKNVEAKEESNEAIKKKEPQDNATEEADKEADKVIEKEKDSSKQGNKQKEDSTKSLDKTEPAPSQVDWGSTWSRNIDTDPAGIDITNLKGDTFKFKLNANHFDNPEDVSTGIASAGDVEGTAKIKGNVATQITDDIDGGCMITMTNYTSYIEVKIQPSCTSSGGGVGVYYDGKYQKGSMSETPQIKVKGTDDTTSTEGSQENPQGSEESATEEAPAQAQDTQTLLTHEQAEELVRKQQGYSINDPVHIVVYDHDDEDGNYVIHDLEDVKDDPNTPYSEAHEATYGWYSVNPKTGEIIDLLNDAY
ncbi:hypothetical protein [Priestia megaterium]|uniref:hypothetical protein n=1 Tax=Priestia megaterium TaxID=1404 RepID=UPI000BF6A039|nr:hypothetical protein [Priestia megaterium]PEU69312.1 hypothetical protein CN397_23290 [Priestia megaterium]PGR01267.1 hypothetical protein COA23_23330 [Priestia megaterium]